MTIIQAKAVDNLGGSTTLANTFPTTCTPGNFRFKFICTRGSTDGDSVAENVGTATWTKRTANVDDPDVIGNTAIQCWVPDTHNAASASALTTLHASAAAIEFFLEDDEIDPAVGLLAGSMGSNGNIAVTAWLTAAKASGGSGNIVAYEVSTSGANSDVSFTAGAGRTAVTGANITTGHHGNTGDNDDMFVQRRVVAAGSYSASGGSSSVTQNSAIFLFQARAAPGGSPSDQALLMML